MSEIRLINKELGEIKIDDKGYFAIPDDIYNAIEQLQQENEELKMNLFSPDQVEFNCPKCGEKFTTNYSREVYDLKYILTEFEKWLEENYCLYIPEIKQNSAIGKVYDKLQELKNKKID
ncbi:hypothetical protein [uncultured Rikenella sp.]|uniref:hypothetical protein n=1 Tax=uncultured Rikenella sp. TaxID=368003 RepID=UPI00261C8041|nr:hypothetical protein [uncultured Rikenella sp.]